MKLPKSHQEIIAMRQLALEDLLAQNDTQLRHEAAEDNENVDALAVAFRMAFRETSAQVLRQRLLHAKWRMANTLTKPVKPAAYPAIEILKRRILSAFDSQPELGLAFREGKRQSESDWQLLYDDLIELGAIAPDEDGV